MVLVSDRVHIVPVGFEVWRVVKPLEDMRAERVYLLRHSEDDESLKDIKDVRKLLEKRKVVFEEKRANIFNYVDTMAMLRRLALEEKNKGNTVFINLSSGTKIAAIAGAVICGMYGVKGYYVHKDPKSYRKRTDNKSDIGITDEIKSLKIEVPESKGITILKVIEKNEGYPQKIEILRELCELENRRMPPKYHNELMKLNKILDYLCEKGWIEPKGSKRKKFAMTADGRDILKIFGSDMQIFENDTKLQEPKCLPGSV